MNLVNELKGKIFSGEAVTKEEALRLLEAPLDELTAAANEIREHFNDNTFDMCTIINGKCGKCSEDCKYCAQSAHYHTACEDSYPLLSTEELLEQAKYNDKRGVLRYSIVTSGRALSDEEVDKACESIRAIRTETNISVCVSFGLLNEDQFRRLKEAGASRVHCNLETSRRYFPTVCTTHTHDEKIETLKAAKRAGLSICSGGIMGLGETMEDRIDMAFSLHELEIRSIPINFLQPIKGTPLEDMQPLSEEEILRSIAVFRYINPDAYVRLAAGRNRMAESGKKAFCSGANAAITGDMLTTSGNQIADDVEMLSAMGFDL